MKKIYTLIIATVFCFCANAQTNKNANHNGFTENKGQIIDQNGAINTSVKFLYPGKGMNVQLKSNGFSYDTYTIEKEVSKSKSNDAFNDEIHGGVYSFHRIDIDLINSNPTPEIIVSEPDQDYFNYYTFGTPEEGIRNVKTYGKVLYKNIYPNIDLEFLSYNENKEAAFKYNFVIHPGGNIADIKINYKGASSLNLMNNQIKIGTAHGPMFEKIPASYIQRTGKTLSVTYSQTGNKIFGFTVSNYDLKETIIIDPIPSLVWATFYGSSSQESATGNGGIGKDSNGNIYISSDTQGPNNIATVGSYQTTISGVQDVFLVKFNSSGVRQWGTYYGGNQDEYQYGSGLCVDQSDNIYICGRTPSTTNIATVGAYDVTLNGTTNAFIAKFNASGIRQWGTYYGNNQEIGCSIVTDGTNYIYVCARSSSVSGLATPGTFMTTNTGGTVVGKFDLNGTTLVWGTYYYGNQKLYLTYDPTGFLYLFGSTSNVSANVASPGAHQTTFGGGTWDNFVGKLDASNGTRLWGTFYGGAGDEGNSFEGSLALDAIGNVYIAGSTTSASTTNISTVGSYQPAFAGGSYDGYLACFNSSGVRQWGTYYGGTGNDRVFAIYSDVSGMLYVTGSTTSTTGISTPNSYQPNYIGADAFISKFDQSGNIIWGTYYGSGGSGFELLPNAGALYVLMRTSSSLTYTTPGAHQSTIGGAVDLFLARFDSTCVTTVQPGIITGPTTVCNGATNNYSITAVSGATSYTWVLPGGWSGTSTTTSISATANSTGGTISVTANNACGSSTAQTLVVSVNNVNTIVTPTNVLCNGNCNGILSNTPSGTGPFTYLWQPGGMTAQTISNLCAGNYSLTVTGAGGCTVSVPTTITQPTVLSATTSSTYTTCGTCCDGTASVNATGGTPAYTYAWSPGGQTSASISGQCNGSYTCCVTDANGCTTCQTVNVSFNVGTSSILPFTSSIDIYPNPFNESVSINCNNLNGQVNVCIYDEVGQLMKCVQITNNTTLIDTQDLSSGIYLFQIKTNDQVITKKLVKTN